MNANTNATDIGQTTIVSMEPAWTTSGARQWVRVHLACGHTTAATPKKHQLRCDGCGAINKPFVPMQRESRLHPGKFYEGRGCPDCGSGTQTITWGPNHGNTDDMEEAVGDTHTCSECRREVDAARAVRRIDPAEVLYTRVRPACGPGSTQLLCMYKRDRTSPSGVVLIKSVLASKEALQAARECFGSGALSPTERA